MRFDGGVVSLVSMDDLAQLRVLHAGCGSPNRLHGLDILVKQALAQNPLAHHSGCSENQDLHAAHLP